MLASGEKGNKIFLLTITNLSPTNFFLLASQIIPRISLRCPHILSHISPESQYQVNNNRRAHRKDGSVHKILPDLAGRYSHPVANS